MLRSTGVLFLTLWASFAVFAVGQICQDNCVATIAGGYTVNVANNGQCDDGGPGAEYHGGKASRQNLCTRR